MQAEPDKTRSKALRRKLPGTAALTETIHPGGVYDRIEGKMKESRKVLVAGTGKSGIAAAKMVLQMGGEVLLYNSNADTDANEVRANFNDPEAVELILGELRPVDLKFLNIY